MSLGIIGGMGPMATVYFMELIVKMSKAHKDSEHLDMVIYNMPSIPDRTQFILGNSNDSPLPFLLELGTKLKQQSVECIAIPCMTAHFFHEENCQLGVPVIHGIRETVNELKRAGVSKVGIMATDGTVSSGIFQKEVEAAGMEAILPEKKYQDKIMTMIYDKVKAGTMPEKEEFETIKRYFMKQKNAEAIVLGCTELSLLKKNYDLGPGVIDTLEVLAKHSVQRCGKEINPEYETIYVPIQDIT